MKTKTQLYTEIMEKLEFEPTISSDNITLSIEGNIVTLAGTVDHYAEKKNIERAIRAIEGVKGVVNGIKVDLVASLRRTDTDIAKAAINALKWDITVPDDKIKVTVDQGYVKLTGEVEWGYQRQNAEKAIRYLAGIKGIDNQLKIRPSVPIVTASEIKKMISKEFERNALIDADNVQVEINGNEIILKGHVCSWPEYKEAERAVWSTPGVTHVDNRLQIP